MPTFRQEPPTLKLLTILSKQVKSNLSINIFISIYSYPSISIYIAIVLSLVYPVTIIVLTLVLQNKINSI